jgi:hypothetical protein
MDSYAILYNMSGKCHNNTRCISHGKIFYKRKTGVFWDVMLHSLATVTSVLQELDACIFREADIVCISDFNCFHNTDHYM